MPFFLPPSSHLRLCDAAAADDDNTLYIVHDPTRLIKYSLPNVLRTLRTQSLCQQRQALMSMTCIDIPDSHHRQRHRRHRADHPLALLVFSFNVWDGISTRSGNGPSGRERYWGDRVVETLIDNPLFLCAGPIHPSHWDTDEGPPTSGLPQVLQ